MIARPPSESAAVMKRYVAIMSATGTLDFLIAFVLLRMGVHSAASLAVSIVVSGVAAYFAMEWWGFPHHQGSFSLRRMLESGGVEFGIYLIRVGVLALWRRHFPGDGALDHFVGLAVAYGAGFVFGYVLRTRVVFKGE